MSQNIEALNILDIIEYLRKKLHLLVASYGLSDPQVLEASQLLDSEISKYYRQNRNS
ncbi:aspartyl-phosphate phosphatase Spo0E family protein [Sporomusa malonica]|uniref:Spo0E like sporulation regulatory protein n=1 Tax=Sporomusa malonica TaxID=112901 RepID=A0A1W1ZHX4_9FIRM|nr:aspartyl-phosphate phosphatase Spo0E family protein [Sporomusa malonica]SMC47923.1 Spo0E like sporulation regulatory protein [Sporomusa malonica]